MRGQGQADGDVGRVSWFYCGRKNDHRRQCLLARNNPGKPDKRVGYLEC